MQTSINKAGQPIAIAGLASDNSEGDAVSRFNGEASAVIPFGVAVKATSSYRDGCVNLSTSTDVVEGVVQFGYNHMPGYDLDQTSGGLLPKAGFKLKQRGRLYALVDSTVATIQPNVDRPYARYSAHTGVGTIVGALTNANDAGYTLSVQNQGIFRSGVFLSGDGTSKIAEVDVDFINA